MAVQAEERKAWLAGSTTTTGNIVLPVRGHRVTIKAWVMTPTFNQWGRLWKRLGAVKAPDALAMLGAFTRGGPLCLFSTREVLDWPPAKLWSAAVKQAVEGEGEGTPCVTVGPQQDGRWLLLLMWCAKAASFSKGKMVQLLIPGLGLSAMQKAEEQIARTCGLRIECRVLDEAEAGKFELLDHMSESDLAMLVEGGPKKAEMAKWVAALSSEDGAAVEGAAAAVARLANLEGEANENRVGIVEAGGIEVLIGLISGSAREAAGRAVVEAEAVLAAAEEKAEAAESLAEVKAAAEEKAAAASVTEVKVPAVATPGAKESAAAALEALARSSESNTAAIVAANGIVAMVGLLKQSEVPGSPRALLGLPPSGGPEACTPGANRQAVSAAYVSVFGGVVTSRVLPAFPR